MDKEQLLASIDFRKFYSDFLKISFQANDQWQAYCPFHDDQHPSLSINVSSGLWHCFAEEIGGDPISFIERLKQLSFTEAINFLANYSSTKRVKTSSNKDLRPPLNPQLVEEYHAKLLKAPEVLNWIIEKRGLTIETIKRFKIGWDGLRNTIPIYDENGVLRNIRRYNAKKKNKWLNFRTKDYSYGEARLFGIDELLRDKTSPVLVCEGEWDKMMLSQNGFLAVTSTAGVRTFRTSWEPLFKDREVYLLFDVDQASRPFASKLAERLSRVAKTVKNVHLPLEGTKEAKDVTDYFLQGFTKEDLQNLIDQTPEFTVLKREIPPPIELSSFTLIDRADLIDKRVKVPLVVSGQTSEAYHAVKKFRVSHCAWLESGKCFHCDPEQEIEINFGEKEYIESWLSTDAQVLGMLRAKVCPFGRKPSIEILEKVVMREFFATQRVKRYISTTKETIIDEKPSELIERKVYLRSEVEVQPQAYSAIGWIKSHPKTQAATFLIESLEPVEEDYEKFQLSANLHHLEAMQKRTPVGLLKLLSQEILKLQRREDLVFALLLTFCSPLRFQFNQEFLRGWLNLAVIGDTSTAKTVAFTRLADFLGIGDIVSGLSASRTGITYGLKEHKQKGWQIKIGRYPMNTRKIIGIDEAQFLSERDFRTLGKAMDEGFITIDRIAERTFESMTRLVCLANPKDDRAMDEHMFGCEALKSIFDKAIIRRFDLAIFTSQSDIENFEELNRPFGIQSDKLDSTALRSLIYWAWTRKSNEIDFPQETVAYILSEATRLANLFGYAFDIPLVAPGDFRNKLARISAALAALAFSTDSTRQKIIVRPEHTEIISDFIERIYSHPNSGLREYSEIYRLKSQIHDYNEIKQTFLHERDRERLRGYSRKFELLLFLLKTNDLIKKIDLIEQLGMAEEWLKEKISLLRRFNLIDSEQGGYRKKPKFIRFLRALSRDPKADFVIGPELLVETKTEDELI